MGAHEKGVATISQEILSAPEVALMLGCCRSQVYRLASKGHIPSWFMLGRSRRWVRQSILDWARDEAQRAGGKTRKGR